MVIEIIKNGDYEVSDTDVLMVGEEYMEKILLSEGEDLEYDEEHGVDITLLCEGAVENGFMNLGELGDGFVFVKHIYELDSVWHEKYFSDIHKWW